MAWVDSVFQFLARARYNAVLPSLSSGDQAELQTDANGRLIVAVGGTSYDGTRLRVQTDPAGILWFATQATPLATTVVKASAGRVHRVIATNAGAATVSMWITDGSTILAPPVTVDPGKTVDVHFPGGRAFATGLTVIASDAYTAPPAPSAAEALWVGAKYE